MQTTEKIIKYLKDNLTEKRFWHTMGVAKTAQSLAEMWGADSASAFLAGLVHDCAKEVSYNETIEGLTENGYIPDEIEKQSTALLHAPYGAILAREIFGIENQEILNAIKYHTVGRPNMTLLEKIVYVADFIEPNRRFDEAEIVRQLAYKDLDKAVLSECDIIIGFNQDKEKVVHPATLITRDYYFKLTKEGKNNET